MPSHWCHLPLSLLRAIPDVRSPEIDSLIALLWAFANFFERGKTVMVFVTSGPHGPQSPTWAV